MEKRNGLIIRDGEECDRNKDNGDKEKWVFDSSFDHQGRVPLRASTGVWKAALFIITIEFSERLSYFGISSNLITYMTKVMHQDLKTAAKIVNCWGGVTTVMPLLGGFLADAYTGRFFMILLSSLIYLMGLSILIMSQFVPTLKPCKLKPCTRASKAHEVAFFLAIYCISLGTGGHKPCLESFGADQFDDDHPQERRKKMSYFNWWNFALCCGLFLGVTLIVYLQDNAGWGVAYLTLAITMTISIVVFYIGKPFYRCRVAKGSPLTPMIQVVVAAIKKRNLAYPSSDDLLYEVPKGMGNQERLLNHTRKFRFLDKAAIIEANKGSLSNEKKQTPWSLSTVTKVEETKLILNMIPIWLTCLPFGICMAQSSTFFVKQSVAMNRNITSTFEIPPASVSAVGALGMLLTITIYEKILVPILRRGTGNERGINILKRIGIGMVFSALAMSIAAIVEKMRLTRVETEARPMSALWLTPQYGVLGIADSFTLVGLQEYFYDQVPDSMRSLGIAFFLSVIGVGSFLSGGFISIMDLITEKTGRGWIGKELSESRLDKFYWLLAAMSGLNLCVYIFVANRYTYKNVLRSVEVGDQVEMVA
ncbi:hypothetical protein LguiA_034907 [Lonicera macranthoides]